MSRHGADSSSKEKFKSISGFPAKQIEEDFERNWTKLRQVQMISHTFDVPRKKTLGSRGNNNIHPPRPYRLALQRRI